MPTSDFTVTSIDKLTVTFDNLSSDADSYEWDFGDGEDSTDETPVHTYTAAGRYTVKLVAYDGEAFHESTKTVNVSKTSFFVRKQIEQLTLETEDSRVAVSPSIVSDGDGRRIVFYEKRLVTGRLTGGRSTSSGLNITVSAGTGTFNGESVSWSSGGLTAAPSVPNLVYFDPGSNALGITADLNMTLVASVIPLAFVGAGLDVVVRILNLETDSRFIVARRQKSDGMGGWIWDDYEEFLNSGEAPSAVVDGGKIYLSYRKDSAQFLRIIELGNEAQAWEFYPWYLEPNAGVLQGNVDNTTGFLNETSMTSSSLPQTATDAFLGGVFSLVREAYGYYRAYPSSGLPYKPYVYLPYLAFSTPPVYHAKIDFYEIYGPDNQTLLESVPFDDNVGQWYDVSHLEGQVLYLGWRGMVSVYPNKTQRFLYRRLKSERLRMELVSDSNLEVNSPTMLRGFVHVTPLDAITSSGLPVVNPITATFTQLFQFETDDTLLGRDALTSSGLPVFNPITATFTQLFEFEEDGTLIDRGSIMSSGLPLVSTPG